MADRRDSHHLDRAALCHVVPNASNTECHPSAQAQCAVRTPQCPSMSCLRSTATDVREPMAKCIFCGVSSERGFTVVFEVSGLTKHATKW